MSDSVPESHGTTPVEEPTLPSSSDSFPVEVMPPDTAVMVTPPASPPPPPRRDDDEEEEDADDDGMLRMSFLGHLEELRSRLLKMLMGVGVAFVSSLWFGDVLWKFVQQPAEAALRNLKVDPPRLHSMSPMDTFNIVWVKLPILAAIFLSSPWIIYQVWAFIAPGLYKRERRWAAPFVICTAGLFILGGCFAYFVAFRFGLTFLLGIGVANNITPTISIVEYFDTFVNVMLGVSIVFLMPVVIFFLTLLRIVTPGFLLRNTRYAILIIVVLAAVVTPTPDIFNLMLFAFPMILLFFVGILASYILTLSREGRRFPWAKIFYIIGVVAVAIAGLVYFAITKYGYRMIDHWPFLTR